MISLFNTSFPVAPCVTLILENSHWLKCKCLWVLQLGFCLLQCFLCWVQVANQFLKTLNCHWGWGCCWGQKREKINQIVYCQQATCQMCQYSFLVGHLTLILLMTHLWSHGCISIIKALMLAWRGDRPLSTLFHTSQESEAKGPDRFRAGGMCGDDAFWLCVCPLNVASKPAVFKSCGFEKPWNRWSRRFSSLL